MPWLFALHGTRQPRKGLREWCHRALILGVFERKFHCLLGANAMHIREVVLLFFSLTLLVSAARVGNCSASAPQKMEKETVEFEVRGTVVTAYVAKQGVRVGNNYFEWSFDKITERLKTPRLDPDLNNDFEGWMCINPRIPREQLLDIIYGGVYLDPLEPLTPNTTCTGFRPSGVPQNTECGAVVQGISPTELDCWSERIQDALNDIPRDRILIHYSHPSHPNFKLISSIELLDGDLNYTQRHNGGEQVIEYKFVSEEFVEIPLLTSFERDTFLNPGLNFICYYF